MKIQKILNKGSEKKIKEFKYFSEKINSISFEKKLQSGLKNDQPLVRTNNCSLGGVVKHQVWRSPRAPFFTNDSECDIIPKQGNEIVILYNIIYFYNF